jgi:hypothetical protein
MNGVQATEYEAVVPEGEEFVKYGNGLQENCSGGGPTGDSDELERIKQLLTILHNDLHWDQLPASVQQSLKGLEGLKRLAAALTIWLTDFGGTAPEFTCEAIAEKAPDLYEEFGEHRVRALCNEIQYSEIPEQSAFFQEMFRTFNRQYFAGRLPDYRILVVYDVWYWETERLRIPPCFPPANEAHGFIDFAGRQILIRFLAGPVTMPQTLIHEMAHAATDGDHGDNWKDEMSRLKLLGAPTEADFLKYC